MSDLQKEDAVSDTVDDETPSGPGDSEGVKGQLKALVTLVPVLGVLWAMIHFLPQFTSWTEKKMKGVKEATSPASETTSEAVANEIAAGNEAIVEVSDGIKGTTQIIDPAKPLDLKAHLKRQLIEQLGGEKKVEVRHIALTEDSQRMVAAVKFLEGEKAESVSGLREIYFERDEFGRYLPKGDEEDAADLKLWSE